MGIFDKFKKGTNNNVTAGLTAVTRSETDDHAFKTLFQRLDEVAAETTKEYSEKHILKKFIEGNQWSSAERNSRTQPVTDNICAPVVEKYVSFFTKSMPKDKIPTRQSLENVGSSETPRIDEEEVQKGYEQEQAEGDIRLQLLRTVKYEDNDYEAEISNAAHNAVGLRDGFMRVVGDEETGKILLTSMNPFHTRIFWAADDYNKIDGYCNVTMRSIKNIFENYGIVVGEEKRNNPTSGSGSDLVDFYDNVTWSDEEKTYIGMAKHFDGWLNGRDTSRKEKQYYLWNITTVGGHVVRNNKYWFDEEIEAVVRLSSIRRTNEPWGKSLIEDIVNVHDSKNGLQMQRNKIWSDMMDLARYAPNNIILGIGTNIDDKELPTGSEPYLIELGRDQDMKALNLAKPLLDFERLLRDNLAAMDDKTGMPRAAFGDLSSIDLATGIGLTTAFESATARLQMVARNWKSGLEKLNKYIYMWTELLYPEATELINKNYLTEVKFGSMQPRDLALFSTVMINQKNANLISTETAMMELDVVESPRQEMVKIANEQNNEWLNPELALQKIQTRAQVQAVLAQQKEQAARPQAGARPDASASETPNGLPEDNQFGAPSPMSQPGEAGGAQTELPNQI